MSQKDGRPVAPRRSRNSKPRTIVRNAEHARKDEFPERGLKIGEAAEVIGVETYVLRFWETQFPFLRPGHSRTRHRFYHERDIEVLRVIKRLLHHEGFTIAGANKYIREVGLDNLLSGRSTARSAGEGPSTRGRSDGVTRRVLSEVRRDLQSLREMLD